MGYLLNSYIVNDPLTPVLSEQCNGTHFIHMISMAQTSIFAISSLGMCTDLRHLGIYLNYEIILELIKS